MPRETVVSYQDLDVWQLAMELVVECYHTAKRLPRSEQFEISAQLRRAAVSIPANIAEGNARHSRKEYAHHVSIACGSGAEVETLPLLIDRLSLAPADATHKAHQLCDRVERMLNRLYAALDD